ncbi:MAG: ribosome small subunit-dependent GTPase A [Chloroflexi bacterium]|nr:ribosome small subunit-dependent GTPase A [Chloroflexota bacterium]
MNKPRHDAGKGINRVAGQSPDQSDASASDDHSDPFVDLAPYGLTEPVSDLFAEITASDPELVPGRVVRLDGISTSVHAGSRDYRAVSTYAIFAQPGGSELDSEAGIEPAQPTVGDWVLVRPGHDNEPDRIELVLPRTSLLTRKRVMRGKEQGDEQLLAANVTTVFIVQSATYFNVARLDREIALVWGSGSVPVVVLSKSDLLEKADAVAVTELAESAAPEIEVFAVSGITGEGTDTLRPFTATGKTVVLIGASGVGKSTLVNQLMGEDVMDTGEIREADDRGRHTTTTRQLLPLPGGGVLIDSPGIRTIALAAGSEEAIAKTFSEVEGYFGKCKFRNCTHEGEPGCAIAEAIADGSLLKSRFDSYRRMQRELQHEHTKNEPGSQTDHQVRMRIIAKSHRQQNRLDRQRESE